MQGGAVELKKRRPGSVYSGGGGVVFGANGIASGRNGNVTINGPESISDAKSRASSAKGSPGSTLAAQMNRGRVVAFIEEAFDARELNSFVESEYPDVARGSLSAHSSLRESAERVIGALWRRGLLGSAFETKLLSVRPELADIIRKLF